MSHRSREVLQVGDVAGVAATLAVSLPDVGWAVRSISLADPSSKTKLGRALEIPSRGLTARRLIHRAIGERKPDVVHVHWARYAPFVGRVRARTVFHAHGSDVRGRSGTVSGRAVRFALDRASAVLVSTPDLLADVGAGARYLPNPVDTGMFAPPAAPVRRDCRPTVLLFARLIDVKGATVMLDAARQMVATVPDVRVMAFRGGAYDVEATEAGVELLARQDRIALVGTLAAADVVVGQLRLGSLGLSELEAMAAAKPVVTHIRPGLYPDDIPLASCATADAVASECARLIDDRQAAAALGFAARHYVIEHHDQATVARQLAAMYEELL